MIETKKCKHCQSDIPKKAKVCPVCKGKQKNTALGIVLIMMGAFGASCSFSNMWSDSDVQGQQSEINQESYVNSELSVIENDEYITLDEFNQIETGMTYKQVVEIIGSEGTVMSEASVMDTTTTIYCWYADNGIANANVTISDEKVMAKAQVGLE